MSIFKKWRQSWYFLNEKFLVKTWDFTNAASHALILSFSCFLNWRLISTLFYDVDGITRNITSSASQHCEAGFSVVLRPEKNSRGWILRGPFWSELNFNLLLISLFVNTASVLVILSTSRMDRLSQYTWFPRDCL